MTNDETKPVTPDLGPPPALPSPKSMPEQIATLASVLKANEAKLKDVCAERDALAVELAELKAAIAEAGAAVCAERDALAVELAELKAAIAEAAAAGAPDGDADAADAPDGDDGALLQ